MILIGTRAMQLRDCLPDWRAGVADDCDLVGSESEWAAVAALLGMPSFVWPSEKSPGVRHIWSKSIGKAEFDASGSASRKALATLPDNASMTWEGLPVSVISAAGHYALKAAIRELSDKHERDYQFFKAMAVAGKLKVTVAHRTLSNLTRTEASLRFGRVLTPTIL